MPEDLGGRAVHVADAEWAGVQVREREGVEHLTLRRAARLREKDLVADPVLEAEDRVKVDVPQHVRQGHRLLARRAVEPHPRALPL